ncbi:unknown protein [Microcystis aeruginosa NIES-843]|uniref:Uncharacterized protein n=1 Tax=Microcystis aeruginosa (strain NIES-843 / IAM M-2473) TaxID=449447 RepID=B0JXB6_MICAN|nr:unknown protein [Microcystis aeruginosa NIES-843]
MCISIKTKTQSLKKVYKGCIRLLQILSHGQLPQQSCPQCDRCLLAFSARGKLLKN